MIMTPEAWTVLGTGIVILVAFATSHRQLRAELKSFRDELRADMKAAHDELRAEMKADRAELRGDTKADRHALDGKIDDIRAELGALRERMAKLEGLLVGLREAITGRQVA